MTKYLLQRNNSELPAPLLPISPARIPVKHLPKQLGISRFNLTSLILIQPKLLGLDTVIVSQADIDFQILI